MATLTVNATTNFSAQALNDITLIDYVGAFSAAFANTQFDNVAIKNNVQLDGAGGVNQIVVSGGAVNASLWTFVNWTAGEDLINLTGSAGNETITGSAEADIVDGLAGNDTLAGGLGNDIFFGGLGDDSYTGGGGGDTIDFSAAAAPIIVNLGLAGPQNTGQGLDTLSGIENIVGSAFGDTITGQNLVNRFDGGGGNDELRGGSGSDTLNGDAGRDIVVGDAGNDTIDGGTEIDRLYGGSGNDTIFGGAGADSLAGGPGIDRIDGGDGADRLYADSTADTFVFGALSAAGDRVFGFQSGIHKLEVNAAGFGGTAGGFGFTSGATPVTTTGQQAFLYDTDDGKLYFDSDGNAADGRVHVCTLFAPGGGAPILSAADIALAGVGEVLDFVILQSPGSISTTAGMPAGPVFGRVFEAGLTEPAGGAADIVAQIGYGAVGTSPSADSGWNWFSASFNAQFGNDDEYSGSLPGLPSGVYAYTFRFGISDGVSLPTLWTYADLDGNGSNAGPSLSTAQLGELLVI